MKILAVVPARLASTRLARKPLRDILGKPMIQRVYEATLASGVADVLIATDSPEIVEIGRKLNMRTEITSADWKQLRAWINVNPTQLRRGDCVWTR